jgi:hypothetical protein
MNLRLSNVMLSAVLPALALMPKHLDSLAARVMLLAIGLQESRFETRRQMGDGPARGFWQFELGTQASHGGVWGIFLHHQTHEQLRLLCHARDCNFDPTQIWAELERDDVLAAGLARLALLADPHPLPALGDSPAGWDCYLRVWRPGKPKPDSWPGLYALAMQEVNPTQQGAIHA